MENDNKQTTRHVSSLAIMIWTQLVYVAVYCLGQAAVGPTEIDIMSISLSMLSDCILYPVVRRIFGYMQFCGVCFVGILFISVPIVSGRVVGMNNYVFFGIGMAVIMDLVWSLSCMRTPPGDSEMWTTDSVALDFAPPDFEPPLHPAERQHDPERRIRNLTRVVNRMYELVRQHYPPSPPQPRQQREEVDTPPSLQHEEAPVA